MGLRLSVYVGPYARVARPVRMPDDFYVRLCQVGDGDRGLWVPNCDSPRAFSFDRDDASSRPETPIAARDVDEEVAWFCERFAKEIGVLRNKSRAVVEVLWGVLVSED